MNKMAKELFDWLDFFCGTNLQEVEARKDVSQADKARAEKEYGKGTEYADEKNKKYPLDAEHIHAAISYWGMEKNRAQYSPEDQKKISAKIAKAAKKHGVELSKK